MSKDDFDEVTQTLFKVFTNILGTSINTNLRPDFYPELKLFSDTSLDIFEISAMRIWRTDRLSLNDNFYNKKSVVRELEEIEIKLREALILFNNLPFKVSLEIEEVVKERLPDTSIFEFSKATLGSKEAATEFSTMFKKVAQGRPFYTLLNMAMETLNETNTFPEEDNRFHLLDYKEATFSEVAKKVNPQRDVNLDRSGKRIKKVIIINELRFLWHVYYQTEAPKSIPYEGSAFGDLVDATFLALGIKADARAAVDAWRSEYDT